MRSPRCLPAVLAVGLTLAMPAVALAQSAGDDQYADPFGGSGGGSQHSSGGGSGSSGSSGSDSSGSTGSSGTSGSSGTTATPAPTAAPAATAAPSTSTGTTTAVPASPTATAATTTRRELPYTGAHAALLAAAGALCLGGGVALRVRLRERE